MTQSFFSQRALFVLERLLKIELPENTTRSIESFTASKGWVTKFVKRNLLRSVALHGEAAGASAQDAVQGMKNMRSKLREYDLECLFNVDETGLFFNLLPRRTYICEH